jgi:hypothetical protein
VLGLAVRAQRSVLGLAIAVLGLAVAALGLAALGLAALGSGLLGSGSLGLMLFPRAKIFDVVRDDRLAASRDSNLGDPFAVDAAALRACARPDASAGISRPHAATTHAGESVSWRAW